MGRFAPPDGELSQLYQGGLEGGAKQLRGRHSRGLRRLKPSFELRNLVAQNETPFLQSAQRQIIGGALIGCLIDKGIKVGMLHAKLDQSALWRMQVVIHESAIESREAKRL